MIRFALSGPSPFAFVSKANANWPFATIKDVPPGTYLAVMTGPPGAAWGVLVDDTEKLGDVKTGRIENVVPVISGTPVEVVIGELPGAVTFAPVGTVAGVDALLFLYPTKEPAPCGN